MTVHILPPYLTWSHKPKSRRVTTIGAALLIWPKLNGRCHEMMLLLRRPFATITLSLTFSKSITIDVENESALEPHHSGARPTRTY